MLYCETIGVMWFLIHHSIDMENSVAAKVLNKMFGFSPHEYYFGSERGDLYERSSEHHPDNSVDGSCSGVLSRNWTDRCYFVQNNDDCQDVAGFINYVSILYCTFGESLFPLGVILYIVWLLFLFIAVGASAEDYLCPSIEIISKSLK